MKRLDILLVEMGLFESRNRASEAIKSGLILVDKVVVKKPSFKVRDIDIVEVKAHKAYVSRSAKKLANYLEEYPLEIKDKICLDIGSSTGGFSQVLLEAGAKEVYSVDVGSNQLHHSLRENKRIKLFEQTDIRDFKLNIEFDTIVSDVSFISLRYILKDIDRLAKSGANMVLLFKPQFEVGKGVKRDKKGVVKDKRAIALAMERFEREAKELNWVLIRRVKSSLCGKEGNCEWIYHFKNS